MTEYLSLTNTSSERLAFKVKTTAPKLYCVRPNASVVEPGETKKISIILQGYTQPLPKDFKCKDKFLIVYCPCPDLEDVSKVAENWAALHKAHGDKGSQKKLRVNFIVEDDAANTTQLDDTTFANATQHLPERQPEADDVSEVQPQQDTTFVGDVSTKAPADEPSSNGSTLAEKPVVVEKAPPANVVAAQETVAGVSIPFAVFLVLVALLLGWYIF